MDDRAHARRTDPGTSHQAAEAVTPGLNAIQRIVEAFARSRPDGFLDVELIEATPDLGQSTLRTRRAELTARNVVLDSGRRRKPDGATTPHTIWIHRDHVAGAPDVVDPAAVAAREERLESDRAEAITRAHTLERFAEQFKLEGRSAVNAELRAVATLLRRLAR